MAKIKKIYDDAARTNQVYPQTHEKAVVDNNGTTLESKLGMITDLVNQKQMEVGAVPIDLVPTKGNTDHIVSSDAVATVDEKVDAIKDDRDGVVFNGIYGNMTSNATSSYLAQDVPFINGHTYKIYLKSDSALRGDTQTCKYCIEKKSGNEYLAFGTAAQILAGRSVTYTASTTENVCILTHATFKYGVNIHFEITDETDEDSLGTTIVKPSYERRLLGKTKESNKYSLFIGSLSLQNINANGNNVTGGADTYHHRDVSTNDFSVIPHEGMKIYFRCDYDIKAYIVMRGWDSGQAEQAATLSSGDSFTVVMGANVIRYRIKFYKKYHTPISVSEIQQMIDNGELELYYYDLSGTIIQRCAREFDYLFNVMGRTNFTIAHATDTHNDHVRIWNFFDFCEQAKVGLTVISGDIVATSSTAYDTLAVTRGLAKHPSLDYHFCMGNHEENEKIANATLYTRFIQPYAETYGWLEGVEDGEPVITTKTWYYKDYPTQNLRVISLNQFEYGGTAWYHFFMSQDQITWFVNTLASTPAGYGVVIIQHSAETQPTAVEGSEEWWSNMTNLSGTNKITDGNGHYIIQDIIDAFIGGSTLSRSYSEKKTGGGTNTLTVDADFTQCATNEFIAYICGHTHQECIGYASNCTQRQLVLCGTATGAHRNLTGANRSTIGANQDCFNLYFVDRTNHKVRIGRVGRTKSPNGQGECTYTAISYI